MNLYVMANGGQVLNKLRLLARTGARVNQAMRIATFPDGREIHFATIPHLSEFCAGKSFDEVEIDPGLRLTPEHRALLRAHTRSAA